MPNRQKISVEEKVEYARAYLRGEITQGGKSQSIITTTNVCNGILAY